METVNEIEKLIKWLDDNGKSTDLTNISLTLGKMSTQCYYFSKLVSDAYEIQNAKEDDYKIAKADYLKNSGEGITKAVAIVEADDSVKKAKREWTQANSLYMRLKNYSHQFETILDVKRQFISVEKALNTKHI